MSEARRHKAFVVMSDEEWRAFRGVCVASGVTVQDALADLARQTIARAGVTVTPDPVPGQPSLDEAIAGPVAGASIKSRLSVAKATKAKKNKRSPAGKKGRPTR